MLKKILFIDRDGTLITEPKENFQVDSLEKLFFEPNVILTLFKLIKFGFKLIMITNQDGLGGIEFPLHNFYTPHNFMLNTFLSQGIKFEHILICPHKISDNCKCRKPKTKLVKQWLKDKTLDKYNSYVIGDRETDIELAKNMKIMGIRYGDQGLNWKEIENKLIKKNRLSEVYRKTKETTIYVKVNLDSQKVSSINTHIRFLDHMIEQIVVHSGIYIKMYCSGDLDVDDHHTVEDIGIVFGTALIKAIGNKVGIRRFGFILPMDESVASCVIDISGRPYINFKAKFKYQKIGDLSTEMIEHFFRSLAYSMKITIHLKATGQNDHHISESLFKSFGRSLKQAINIENNILPTSKGIL